MALFFVWAYHLKPLHLLETTHQLNMKLAIINRLIPTEMNIGKFHLTDTANKINR